MNAYEVVVFDVDGTLLDTTEGVISAVGYTMDKMGLPRPEEDIMKSFIGPPIQESFARVYNLEGPILQDLATVFRNRYKDVDLLKATPYDGIYKVFDALTSLGIKCAVATYKRQDYAVKILKHFGFDKYTDILYGADHENKLKKVDIIRNALIDSGVSDYSKAVMVGDSSHDAIGAEKIAIDFIGVTYGFEFKTKEDVYQYPCIGWADCPEDLIHYFSR